MSARHDNRHRARSARGRVLSAEALEARELLATAAAAVFNPPPVHGRDALVRLPQALVTQIQSGPLAQLRSRAISNAQFVTAVLTLERGYETFIDGTIWPHFPRLAAALNLEGEHIAESYIASFGLKTSLVATALGSVSGTATTGGTATLTATLTNAATGGPIEGQVVNFVLNGAAVGNASTDANGVARLTGVAIGASTQSQTGAVLATFGGNTDYTGSSATGNLTVTAAAGG